MSVTETKSTPAPFQPNPTKYLARFNAIEILAVLLGVAACAFGPIGMIVGIPVVLIAIYSAFFIPPKINRGLYIGKCPHCGADMSATHYQTEVDCPNCTGWVAVRDARFVALPGKPATQQAAAPAPSVSEPPTDAEISRAQTMHTISVVAAILGFSLLAIAFGAKWPKPGQFGIDPAILPYINAAIQVSAGILAYVSVEWQRRCRNKVKALRDAKSGAGA
jgi:hypothetical protein